MTPEAHQAFTAALLTRLSCEPDVVGLVALGSTSGIPPGPDPFSDHDFFIVTRPGTQERFRCDLGWLPDSAEIALSFRETAHGVKALYASGHLVEFAVFDPSELTLARVNRYCVLLDRADVESRLEQVRAATAASTRPPDIAWHLGQFLTRLVVGAGRSARGEKLAGHELVRHAALGDLLVLLRARLPKETASRLDDLDPNRRLEMAMPTLSRELDLALREPVTAAARKLLAVAAREFPDLIPHHARAAVERALARADTEMAPGDRASLQEER